MSPRKPSADRRAEILAATLDLAFEVGPDHVSTGMIAARLGLKQPAIYKHFPRKEDIWQVVSETLCAAIGANRAARIDAGADPMARVRHMVRAHLGLVERTPALPEIIVTRDPSGALTSARRDIQAAMGRFRDAMTGEIERARAAGQLRAGLASDDAATLVFGVVQSLVLRLMVTRDTAHLVQEGQRLLDLQLALLTGAGEVP